MTNEVQKEGIDDLEKCIHLLGKGVALGIKIGKGGLDSSDVQYLKEVESYLEEAYAFIKAKPHLADEAKDIDFAEAIVLLKDLYDEFKQVKA